MNKKVVSIMVLSVVTMTIVVGGMFFRSPDPSPPIDTRDTEYPTIQIQSPIDSRVYNNEYQLVNITAQDNVEIDNIWYNWNGIDINYTSEIYVEFDTGWNFLHAWANDTSGNTAETSIAFNVENTPPEISINNPYNITYSSATHVLDISASDYSGIDEIWYNWYGVNITYTSPISILFNEGVNIVQIWANDTLGTLAAKTLIFTIDNAIPTIEITNPTHTIYESSSQNLIITASDGDNIDKIWYNWEGVNVTYTSPILIVFKMGRNTITVWANDTLGNIASRSVNFVITGNNFTSVWDTAKTSAGSSGSNQVKFPLYLGGEYNFIVDWNDGTKDTITSWNQPQVTHTYASSGNYTINITGIFYGWCFWNNYDKLKIKEIKQWGDFRPGNQGHCFEGCTNLNITATDILDLEGTTTLFSMFTSCSSIGNISNINEWDVSKIVNMNSMFDHATNFNASIGDWDVSSVTDMGDLFYYATKFNQDIGDWDVSSVIEMGRIFGMATNFNQNISKWDVSKVTSMNGAFSSASNFNQNISSWDVSRVTDFTAMFQSANKFNQNIGCWNVSSATKMHGMFYNNKIFNQDIGSWDVSKVTTMYGMFYNATSFNQDLGGWNVSKVTNMVYMFILITLSTANYDSILIGWSQLNLANSVSLDAGYSKYSAGAAATARQYIKNTFGWTIYDGGQV